ncbi:hypothetical protein B0H13DRAFT_1853585 [Mycena leptocephala]|nr:hypothetical protein B0H13DRAFT_1853585 [Mycena leptocephala]
MERDVTRQNRVAKAQEALANTTAITSVQALDTAFQITARGDGYLSITALDLQLDWHIANPVKELPNSEATSASGIPKAKSGPNGRGTREKRYQYLREAISKRAGILESVVPGPDTMVDGVPPALEVIPSAMDVDDGGYDSEDDWPQKGRMRREYQGRQICRQFR